MDNVEMLALTRSIATVVREQIAAAVNALVIPKGDKGDPGDKGADGKDGDNGKDGIDGRNLVADDFRSLFEVEYAKWTLEFERRANDTVQKFMEKIPKPLDGKDGLGFDDLSVLFDGERLITLRFARGEQVKEFPIEVPAMIHRGVFKREDAYRRGDNVTYGGSVWIAQGATQEVPGDGSTAWRLAVKKGRDGKDGKDAEGPRVVKFGAK